MDDRDEVETVLTEYESNYDFEEQDQCNKTEAIGKPKFIRILDPANSGLKPTTFTTKTLADGSKRRYYYCRAVISKEEEDRIKEKKISIQIKKELKKVELSKKLKILELIREANGQSSFDPANGQEGGPSQPLSPL